MIRSSIFGFAFLLTVASLSAHPKDSKYPVSDIPDALKQGANVVVREDETTFTILSRNSSTMHMHYAVTIMNSNGRDAAYFSVGYDKLSKLRDVRVVAYDANGEVLKKAKSVDFVDRAYTDAGTLFSDDRMRFVDMTQGSYPYTVEYEYDIDYSHLFYIPSAYVNDNSVSSVQKFSFQLVYPIDLKPRFKAYNIPQQPEIAQPASGKESMTWRLSNLPTLNREPMSQRAHYTKKILASPSAFEIKGYAGNMSNWENLGRWQIELNKDRDILPPETKKKLAELVKGLDTNEKKVRAIYEYMQSKTRYVGIQLGIGGWQPFDATTVDQNGYGDCKALSNYMVAMLKEVGIPSHYTLIRSGTGENIDPTFPGNFFNHIIVAVPNKSDTIWLECTSQTMPFGYLGDFTDNRYGLMITENGGKLARTTSYKAEINQQLTRADVQLDLNGNATAKVKTDYTGLQYENNGLSFYVNYSAEEQKKWIQKNTRIPGFNVDKFKITNKKEKIPTATVEMDLTLNKFASLTNKRLFLTPNLMNRSGYIPEKVENRKMPFVLKFGYVDSDTITYTIPESMYPEFLPANSKLSSRFGSYESGFKLDQGMLIYFRRITIKDGEYPAEAYQELVDFYKSVNKADNTKLVFLSKT